MKAIIVFEQKDNHDVNTYFLLKQSEKTKYISSLCWCSFCMLFKKNKELQDISKEIVNIWTILYAIRVIKPDIYVLDTCSTKFLTRIMKAT